MPYDPHSVIYENSPEYEKTILPDNNYQVWNTLPDTVVNAQNVNTFKNRLDRHWRGEDFLYNYEAPIPGHHLAAEPGRSTLNVLNYKYKYFPPGMYLSTSTFVFGEMYLSTFRVLSKCT